MRIVHALGWYFPDTLGGTEVYVAALCRRLLEAGHEAIVAAPDPGARAPREYRHDGVRVLRYPTPPSPTRQEARGEAPVRGAEFLDEQLGALRPDVLHVHTLTTGLGASALRAARIVRARTILTAHESRLGHLCQRGTLMRWGRAPCDGVCRTAKCAACALEGRGLPRPIARALALVPPAIGARAAALPGRLGSALSMPALIDANRRLQRELLGLLDRFVVLTRVALEMLERDGAPPDKLALNRLGVDLGAARRKPDRPTAPPVRVGFLGRFDRVKGAHVLAAAMARLPPEVPLRVELRGPRAGAEGAAIEAELRAAAGGDARVHFADPVPRDRVPEVLAGYDVLCCPSLCFEGGPTVALEAHAVGTPVVGSRLGGLAEIVSDDAGALVPPGDPAALAALLRRIAADPAGTLDRWRRHLPSPRTMDDVARDYLDLYAAA